MKQMLVKVDGKTWDEDEDQAVFSDAIVDVVEEKMSRSSSKYLSYTTYILLNNNLDVQNINLLDVAFVVYRTYWLLPHLAPYLILSAENL